MHIFLQIELIVRTITVYYVQTDGTLSTTAGDPSVVAGRAISATELLITRS